MTLQGRHTPRLQLALLADTPAALSALEKALTPAHKILWRLADPGQLVAQCRAQKPELLLLQLNNGTSTALIQQLMAEAPCALLLLTTDEQHQASQVFEAMGNGALDVIPLPGLSQGQINDPAILVRKVHNLGWIIGSSSPALKQATTSTTPRVAPNGELLAPLIAIGASAGGPATLNNLLRALPTDFAAAIVLVQHLDDKFSQGMAEWLAQESALPVRLARAGEAPQPGQVLLAARNDHLYLGQLGELHYCAEPEALPYRPSIDVFFHSLARHWRGMAIGVLLTGMGSDGAQGLKAMRERGFPTIAQDEASSAVYGMPKAAAALNAAVEILPLERIAARLVALCQNTLASR